MAHLSSIGAGLFSDMSVATPATALTTAAIAALDTDAEFAALFATEIANAPAGAPAAGAFVRILNVREFPGMGTPANIVNVPVYGKRTSSQIQGQSDAPSMELTLNFVGVDWAKTGSLLGPMVGDGVQRIFRFAMLNSEPTGTGATKYAQTVGGLGTVANSDFYFAGKIEAVVVNPNLTDANQATLTISMQTDLFGPFTI
jgi:hypothetical protein